MKPEAGAYDLIPPLPEGGLKKKEPIGCYCAGCGQTFTLSKREAYNGVDENGKPFVNQCLLCKLESSQTF